MIHVVRRAFSNALSPMLPRKSRQQVAAICYRTNEAGKEVLLITSRDTGRWIVPKGWPINHKTPSESAAQEAWEEAGVVGRADSRPLGLFSYTKIGRASCRERV